MSEEEEEVWVDAPTSWAHAQEIVARELDNRVNLALKKVGNLSRAIKQCGDEAEKAKLEEERVAMIQEYQRVHSLVRDPDYSGMTEAERAEESERIRQEVLQEARHLKLEGDLNGGWAKERQARIIDFDPKQGGLYYNRFLFFHDRADHDQEFDKESIAIRLSTVSVIYAVVKQAVEATIAVKVLQGEFYGTITAHTTSIQECLIVLYDSKMSGAKTGDDHGLIQLMRPVICVYVKDMLIIDAKTDSDESVCIEFAPRGNKGEKVICALGTAKLCIKVSWSVMDP
ncbi:hypothetical protein PR202_gb25210 [Eleusine coracana subsp. coracana]|uniref:DUF6598 domain-containing protein n=1 Tax=Eleusine coracana subsp. coracana TaxID=191504 RepID=A0AAV5FPJ7_ELECO|nr:hypothetical protein PR202_gb25210 [Eleusine coracana subsp. coracana]